MPGNNGLQDRFVKMTIQVISCNTDGKIRGDIEFRKISIRGIGVGGDGTQLGKISGRNRATKQINGVQSNAKDLFIAIQKTPPIPVDFSIATLCHLEQILREITSGEVYVKIAFL